ncbi:PTS hybrid protein/phosphocarrier protein FPr [Raineyella antarctica]|uniref:phosphoenolpyruvate--glycerone phosphotransferase n=1 Tax=Raineyella antarctica TaxID=1577474 RepID=A0A1G6GJB3_9ACTN|nr:dihydroxyacetone kinase phosphoryl donor subunit DhaM [Raineyella antarctica]SDB82030.1 PTS hybrid protein/phosphocarrier protein FPr [Raineyella antarctica]
MISILVVSHSRPLAEAAAALASEMVPAEDGLRIGVAAGIDTPDGPAYGTDAAAVAQAITTYDSPEGVLVLMDIGSSVLSAQLALEFLEEEEIADRVLLCSAPLVEGLLAAAVAAAGGATLERAAAQARAGLFAKQYQVADVSTSDADPAPAGATRNRPPASDDDPWTTCEVEVTSPVGLHLRPVGRIVALVLEHEAEVRVSNLDTGQGPLPADSLADMLSLAADCGHRLRFEARGPRADDVLDAIAALAGTGFGDS